MLNCYRMGKRNEKNKEDGGKPDINISSDAKRSIVAIFLFALSVLFVLGFLGNAGILGKYLNKITGSLFGWGKWLSPLVLAISGIILLYRKETLFYVSKLLGLLAAFLGVLGFLHLYFDFSSLLDLAKKGEGGGYCGYVISYSLLKFTGVIAGTVILFALFLSGIVVAFNFSVVSFFQKIISFGGKSKEAEQEKEAEKKVEFVKGPEEEKNAESYAKTMESQKSRIASVKEKLRPSADWKEKKELPDYFSDENWKFPPLDLLELSNDEPKSGDIEKNAEIIKRTLGHFGIEVEPGEVKVGPTVTQYSFRPAVGVKLSKITSLSNDLALALAAHPIRIEAPIPGKSLIGIEVPNKKAAIVKLRELLKSDSFRDRKSNLTLTLGKDVSGNYTFADLKKMPHLMIAGSTGSGKSVCVNSILISLLYQNSPENLRLILVDPKRVELSLYNGIPHLLSNVVVENDKVVNALKWVIGEMERRYSLLQDTGSRDLASYNNKIKNGQKRKYADPETGEEKEEELERLPYIVIVIDELADLMVAHGKEVEGAIIRLAQMARAVGIHLIVSTQRPSVDVLTGLIKANIATRIAFKVATQVDSRTILDGSGAEKLLGNGDMLYVSYNSPGLKRLQGVFVSESEVKKVVKFIKNQKAEIEEKETEEEEDIVSYAAPKKIDFSQAPADNKGWDDCLYEEAKKIVIESRKASTTFLQRRLRIGYARAARLVDMLENNGIVGKGDGAKPREIFLDKYDNPDGLNYENPINDQNIRDKWQM